MRRFVLPASLMLAILMTAGALTYLKGPDGASSASATAGDLSTGQLAVDASVDSSSIDYAMSAQNGASPVDADGWQALGRSESKRGEHAQAVVAFRNASRLRPNDAALLSEYAFSAAVTSARTADDDPERLIQHALQIDPTSPQALTLAGSLALDRGDFEAAAKAWERLAQLEPIDSAMRRDVEASAVQARRLASLRAGVRTASYAMR